MRNVAYVLVMKMMIFIAPLFSSIELLCLSLFRAICANTGAKFNYYSLMEYLLLFITARLTKCRIRTDSQVLYTVSHAMAIIVN